MPGYGWGDNGGILNIEVNEYGQPIMAKAPQLASHLGVLARNGSIAPLNFEFWKDVPDFCKEAIWDHILVLCLLTSTFAFSLSA